MKQFLASLSFLAFLLFGTAASLAAQVGTPAWSIRPLLLMEGPGNAYDVVGEIDGQVRIYVDRCSGPWCRVHAGKAAGWTSLYSVAFGRGPFSNLRPIFNSGGPGVVCLYEGHNFTGPSLCAGPGFRARDLLLLHADNAFSSVSIEGNVSVMLCRDRGFHSYCERINDSQRALQGFLDKNVSSVRVY